MKTVDNDFATFVQTNWSLVEFDKLIWSPHMQIICDAFQDVVEDRNSRLIVNVPHGTGKSLLAAVFLPAWIQKVAGGRVGIVSDCRELARRDFQRSKQITRENWPNQGAFGSLDWFSVEGGTTAQRFDMLILDVSNGPRNGKGWADAAEIVWKTRLYDMEKGKVILIETRSEHGDVTGRLLAKGAKGEWRHICLPMVYESTVAKEDFRTEEGQLLCPERWTQETLDGYRLMLGEVGYNAQYQQNPPARAGEALQSTPKPVAVSAHASTPEVAHIASTATIRIVLSKPPGPDCDLVEVEDIAGRSLKGRYSRDGDRHVIEVNVPVGMCSNKNCYVHEPFGESCAKGGDSVSCLDRVGKSASAILDEHGIAPGKMERRIRQLIRDTWDAALDYAANSGRVA